MDRGGAAAHGGDVSAAVQQPDEFDRAYATILDERPDLVGRHFWRAVHERAITLKTATRRRAQVREPGVDVAEAAIALGKSKRTLQRLLAEGAFAGHAWRVGRSWRFDRRWLYGE